MEYLQSSFFICLLSRFWDRVTELFRGGAVYRFCMWCWSAMKNGMFYRFAVGGARADALWTQSVFCRALAWLADLPVRLCAWLWRVLAAENSLICRGVTFLSRRLLCFYLGMVMLAMLIIPQGMWNNAYSLAAMVLGFAAFAAAGARYGDMRFSLREIGFFPCFFAFCVCLSFVTSEQMDQSLRFLVFGVTCMIMVLLTANSIKTPQDLHLIVQLVSLGLAAGAAYAVLQRIMGVETNVILTDMEANAGMPGRVYSFFENPNSFANILVLFAPLMLTKALFAPGRRLKLWYLLVFVLCSGALIMTYSRGGWLSLAVAMGVLLLALGPRWVPLCIVLCALAVPFLPDTILNRLLTIFSGSDSSIYTRAYIYSAMGRLIMLFPVFGAGLGAQALRHAVEAYGVYDAEALFVHGHNIYLQIWGEMGIFALIAFIGSMAFAVRGGLRLRAAENGVVRAAAVGAACGLCGSLFFGITDYAWSYPRVMVMFWFVFALIPACARIAGNKEGVN